MRKLSLGKRLVVGGAAVAAMLGISSTAASAKPPLSALQNNETYWENLGYGECTKYEDPGTPFELGDAPDGSTWTLLVIKAGSDESVDTPNDVIVDPEPGDYGHSSGKEISHVIVCMDEGYSPS